MLNLLSFNIMLIIIISTLSCSFNDNVDSFNSHLSNIDSIVHDKNLTRPNRLKFFSHNSTYSYFLSNYSIDSNCYLDIFSRNRNWKLYLPEQEYFKKYGNRFNFELFHLNDNQYFLTTGQRLFDLSLINNKTTINSSYDFDTYNIKYLLKGNKFYSFGFERGSSNNKLKVKIFDIITDNVDSMYIDFINGQFSMITPNNYIDISEDYIIITDPLTCDIFLYDLSGNLVNKYQPKLNNWVSDRTQIFEMKKDNVQQIMDDYGKYSVVKDIYFYSNNNFFIHYKTPIKDQFKSFFRFASINTSHNIEIKKEIPQYELEPSIYNELPFENFGKINENVFYSNHMVSDSLLGIPVDSYSYITLIRSLK